MEERARAIRRAATVALGGNTVLAAAKVAVGFLAGSLAVVGDGMDTATDVVISAVTLVAARVMTKPSDPEHPYGHTRAETLATTALAFVIFFAGAQLFISTLAHFFEAVPVRMPDPGALVVTAVSIVGKLLLAWSQFAAGRTHCSAMLTANGKNMRNDVLLSSAVLIGLGLTLGLGLPILDRVVALVVSVWVMRTAVGIYGEAQTELMDGTTDSELYQSIFAGVSSVEGAGNPHRARIRKIGALYDIDLDIEVAPTLTVASAHEVAVRVERAIRERIDNVFDILVHVEPEGNEETHEVYGLSEKDLPPNGCR